MYTYTNVDNLHSFHSKLPLGMKESLKMLGYFRLNLEQIDIHVFIVGKVSQYNGLFCDRKNVHESETKVCIHTIEIRNVHISFIDILIMSVFRIKLCVKFIFRLSCVVCVWLIDFYLVKRCL